MTACTRSTRAALDERVDPRALLSQIATVGRERHVEADVATVAEAVGHGLRGRRDLNQDSLDAPGLHTALACFLVGSNDPNRGVVELG